MKFINVDFNNGEMAYAGEARQGYRGYEPNGFGVMKWMDDERLVMCNNYTNDGTVGLGFEYYPNGRYGSLTTFNYGRFYGPTMSFGYEKYLIYENYDYYEKQQNFSIRVFNDGNYVIYEESNGSVRNGVAYNDGYLYFVKVDLNFNILSHKEIKYVGPDYRFTLKRMFCMKMDETKVVHNETGRNKDGSTFELSTQILTPYQTTYFGYGAIKWSSGTYYFGEWYDNNREGTGCLVFANGERHMGTFYKNKKYGNMLSVYANNIIRMGNWENDHQEGISFEIHDDCVVILNYRNGQIVGNRFQVNKGSEYVSEFNSSGNVGRYYY